MQKLKEQIIEIYSDKIIDTLKRGFRAIAEDYFEDMKKCLLKVKELEDLENGTKTEHNWFCQITPTIF